MFEFNKPTEWILGRPNFWCSSMIVPALRASGQDNRDECRSRTSGGDLLDASDV